MRNPPIFLRAAPMSPGLALFTQPAQAVIRIDTCRTITQSGSYRVVRNLTASGNRLTATSDHVPIDWNGHKMSGDGSGTAVCDRDNQAAMQFAIQCAENGNVIRSGQVLSNRLMNTGAFGGRFSFDSAVTAGNFVSDTGGNGINVGGDVVTGNPASGSGSDGIVAIATSVIGNCVQRSDRDGLSATGPSRLTDNAVRRSDQNPVDGYTGLNLRLQGTGRPSAGNASGL